MSTWEHLSEVPIDVRTTMTAEFIKFEKQDLVIESTIDLAINAMEVTESTCRALRGSANKVRLPLLVREVSLAHPKLSKRKVFMAVSLFVGIHPWNVQKYYYAERGAPCSR